jgi:hypothetical protein
MENQKCPDCDVTMTLLGPSKRKGLAEFRCHRQPRPSWRHPAMGHRKTSCVVSSFGRGRSSQRTLARVGRTRWTI